VLPLSRGLILCRQCPVRVALDLLLVSVLNPRSYRNMCRFNSGVS
jgi:hypothetical protein